jgi:predicted neuraminidase
MKAAGVILMVILASSTSCSGQPAWKKVTEAMIFSNPPFKQCHASTLVEPAPGQLMAAWFAGTHERHKDVEIWLSVREQGRWSQPVSVANGVINDTLRYPCWNPVLFKDDKGTLHLFYKVGPSPQQWWGMQITSTDQGKTWSSPVRLPNGILGPIKNKPVQLPGGTIVSPSSTESPAGWKVHMERSTDGGRSWQSIPVDTANPFRVIQPTVLQYANGRLQILCRSNQGYVVQSWSNDRGKTWGKLINTELPNPNSGIDAVTLTNGWQLLVYNHDKPGREWQNGRAKLHVAVSKNGAQWKDIAVLENGTTEEYSYPAVIQTADGKVHITYTFNRQHIKYVVLEEVDK